MGRAVDRVGGRQKRLAFDRLLHHASAKQLADSQARQLPQTSDRILGRLQYNRLEDTWGPKNQWMTIVDLQSARLELCWCLKEVFRGFKER